MSLESLTIIVLMALIKQQKLGVFVIQKEETPTPESHTEAHEESLPKKKFG